MGVPTTTDPDPNAEPARADALVRFSDLYHRYGSTGGWVLEAIDLEVRDGELVGLIGPSGCGKSTMLKLISGLTQPSRGELRVDGMDPVHARAEMAFVFQEATLLPWLTVRGNVELPMRLKGLPPERRREQSEALLHLVKLGHVADAYPRQLSGGMKMRTSIARALSLQPRIMLLDEPFGSLDEMTRDKLNDDLLEIREQEQWTGFFVTHSVTEAVFLSSRIVILSANPGQIESIVDVPFAYPRAPALRDSLEFHNAVCEVSRILRGTRMN